MHEAKKTVPEFLLTQQEAQLLLVKGVSVFRWGTYMRVEVIA
jgi:hypothetical protein